MGVGRALHKPIWRRDQRDDATTAAARRCDRRDNAAAGHPLPILWHLELPGAERCRECGTYLQARACPQCGVSYSATANFCMRYGSSLNEDLVSPTRISWLRRLIDAYDRGLDEPLSSVERAALPLAIARQPLWWVGRWLVLLDDEEQARRGFAQMAGDLDWALQIVREAERWHAAFA